jgi:hypothetical protein
MVVHKNDDGDKDVTENENDSEDAYEVEDYYVIWTKSIHISGQSSSDQAVK